MFIKQGQQPVVMVFYYLITCTNKTYHVIKCHISGHSDWFMSYIDNNIIIINYCHILCQLLHHFTSGRYIDKC